MVSRTQILTHPVNIDTFKIFVGYSVGTSIPNVVALVKDFIFVKLSPFYIDLILDLCLNEVCLIYSLANCVSPGRT